ncbi:MAG TPA: hypothetical protein VI757_12785 [Bacteroidia bacterium]|nr:hypothetical protein [Bacteroidia bacterium]
MPKEYGISKMKSVFRNILFSYCNNFQSAKNYTLKSHPTALWRVLVWVLAEMKKAGTPLLSVIPALVPGVGVEPTCPCGHWCLRPASIPEIRVIYNFDVAFGCKTKHFRTSKPHLVRTSLFSFSASLKSLFYFKISPSMTDLKLYE